MPKTPKSKMPMSGPAATPTVPAVTYTDMPRLPRHAGSSPRTSSAPNGWNAPEPRPDASASASSSGKLSTVKWPSISVSNFPLRRKSRTNSMIAGVGELLYLSRADVEQLLDVDAMLDALGDALVAYSSGAAVAPPRTAVRVERGLLGVMPGYVPGVALESKLVSVF